ncbi:MAG: signal peptide peptidase SppA [Candidatus Melainabacteria bacterium]|nr:signal peptide peptidase SppA [Candidatus Melainabacteria bacterium]
MENKKNKKNIAAIIIIFSIICLIISLFLPSSKTIATKELTSSKSSGYFPFKSLHTTTPFKDEHISVIRIDGIISDSPSVSLFRDLTSSSTALELIKKVTEDKSSKGLVIRINSPGGTVAASQELYEAIRKAKKEKPVVITMGDIAASGGYYIAAAGDTIFANPGTITGSIGVITSYINVHQLFTMYGLEGVTIKSGKYKDIGSPTRPMTEEERKILQSLLDDSYHQFISDVASGRNIPIEKVSKLAEGLIYTGKQAKNKGLIDFVGDYSKALKHTQKLVKKRFPDLARKYKNKDIPIQETWRGTSLIDLLVGATNHISPKSSLELKLLKPYTYSKFQPLWLLE